MCIIIACVLLRVILIFACGQSERRNGHDHRPPARGLPFNLKFLSRLMLSICAGIAVVGIFLAAPIPLLPLLPEQHSSAIFLEDIATQAGLTALNVNGGERAKKYIIESSGSGVALLDYDNDGWPDVFMVNGTRLENLPPGSHPSNRLYRNRADLSFVDVTEEAGLVRSGWGQGVCSGDYDNDGNLDFFVTYYGPNVLYRNLGTGKFEDVSLRAGVAGEEIDWSTGCAFVDYDGDGWLDLFVAHYLEFDYSSAPQPGANQFCFWKGVPVFCGPRGFRGQSSVLYRNNRNGTFSDVSHEAQIRLPGDYYGFAVLTGDFQNRGLTDIYVACDSTASLLFHNNGDGTFREVGIQAGCAYSEDGVAQAGMGAAAGDYDADGFLDILKTNFSDDTSNLYRNNGDGTFNDSIFDARLGHNVRFLGWGCGFSDFDNDGWKDIFIANGHVYPELESHGLDAPYRERNLLYRNRGNGTFEDISSGVGPDLQALRSSRGVAFGDLDNDGRIDVVINNQNDPLTLLINRTPQRNNALMLKLIGTKSNRAGIGARVTVFANGHSQIDEVRSGGSYISQSDLRLHFGLGRASGAEWIEVRWPSGALTRLRDVPANQTIVAMEGKGIVSSERLSDRVFGAAD